MLKDNVTLIDSKSSNFVEKVLAFGRENIGKSVTFNSFEKWLDAQDCSLISTDIYWRAIFTSILKSNFVLENYYDRDNYQQIVTVFQIER